MEKKIIIRKPESIYQAHGSIQNGTFHGRWHYSFDQYHDPEYTHFGTLRVFNDDTLSPGAVKLNVDAEQDSELLFVDVLL